MIHKVNLVFAFLFVGLLLSGCAGKITCVEDESYFCDFAIQDEHVEVTCFLTVQNETEEEAQIRILGDFSEDQASGLVLESSLPAKDGEGNEIFTVFPGENTFHVTFVGTHGISDTRQDRLLPPIRIVPVS